MTYYWSLLRAFSQKTLILWTIIFLVLLIILSMLSSRKNTLSAEVARMTGQLQRMNTLAATIPDKTIPVDPEILLTARKENFSLFSFVNTAIDASSARKYISSIEPGTLETAGSFQRQEAIILFEKGPMQTLVQLLTAIESPKMLVTVRSLTINRAQDGSELINARITAVTLKKNGS